MKTNQKIKKPNNNKINKQTHKHIKILLGKQITFYLFSFIEANKLL